MKPIVTLALGIIIGAGGMWFMQKSSEKTLQVDEVIESYSAPIPGDNQGHPAAAPAAQPTTTGSTQGQMNLSEAAPTDGSQDSTTDSSNSQSQGGY